MKINLVNVFEDFLKLTNDDLDNSKEILKNVNGFTKTKISLDCEDLDKFKLTNVLYYFEIPENFGITPAKICERISQEKETNKELKLPKVNFENLDGLKNRILYVGKSSGNFKTRLKQHIGNESKWTYALHLKKWIDMFDLSKNDYIYLNYVSFDELNEDNKHLLELIETSLHYKLKPILGRTGH